MYNNIGISFPHSLFNPFVPVNVHFHSTLYTPHLCQKKKKSLTIVLIANVLPLIPNTDLIMATVSQTHTHH